MSAVSFLAEYPMDAKVANDTNESVAPMENRVFSTDDAEGTDAKGLDKSANEKGNDADNKADNDVDKLADQHADKGVEPEKERKEAPKEPKKKRVQYAVNQRYSDLEILEKDEANNEEDKERMKLMKTLPPKYSDDSDIRNNIICTSSNIYIYAENRHGGVNEEACISVTDDNRIIYCSAKGRRYTIGGYANIGKKLNDEYHFFEEPISTLQSLKTLSYAPLSEYGSFHEAASFHSLKYPESKNFSNMTMTTNQSNSGTEMGLNSLKNLSGDSNRSTTDGLTRKFSVQKLFHDYKTYTQNVEHDQRTCKPCAHVYNGSVCMNGDKCAFCHHPDHVLISAKKWKKLVKNNLEKLNIILHILRNPDDPNNEMLKEMIKPAQNYYQTKRMSPRSFNGSSMKTMNVPMDMSMNVPMDLGMHANSNLHTNPVSPAMDYYVPKRGRHNRYMMPPRNMEPVGRLPHYGGSMNASPVKGMYHPPYFGNGRRYPRNGNFNMPAYNMGINK